MFNVLGIDKNNHYAFTTCMDVIVGLYQLSLFDYDVITMYIVNLTVDKRIKLT